MAIEGRQRPNLKSEDSGLRHRFSEAKVSLWMCENGTGHELTRTEMARDAAAEEEKPIVWEDPPVYRPPPPPKTQAEKDLQAQLDRLKAMKTGVQETINSMPREWWKFQRPDGVIFW